MSWEKNPLANGTMSLRLRTGIDRDSFVTKLRPMSHTVTHKPNLLRATEAALRPVSLASSQRPTKSVMRRPIRRQSEPIASAEGD
jgi:hypothetical protein